MGWCDVCVQLGRLFSPLTSLQLTNLPILRREEWSPPTYPQMIGIIIITMSSVFFTSSGIDLTICSWKSRHLFFSLSLSAFAIYWISYLIQQMRSDRFWIHNLFSGYHIY
ncbi:hypothetical protein CDAR_103931 [Caerostris darwini]|uniref:Uncharacterized protein n=1 Tax=Caerostris darwini TaxID=1538125 RepID=A0AAV4T0S7_9ARAC|nr:hypothetical protein CDAR_103931 [Caerostris darwini]